MSLLLLFGGVAPVTDALSLEDGASLLLEDGGHVYLESAAGATGTLAKTLGDTTSAAAGTVGDTGTVAVTLTNATSAASGASGAAGTIAKTLADATSAASGGSGAAGTAARTLADITSNAAGASGAAGTLAVTLGDTTSAATGSVPSGTLAVTLGNVTCVAAGIFTATIGPDPSPVHCSVRRARFSRNFRYHRHAERPAIQAWAFDSSNSLIDFSGGSYSFLFRIGNPGDDAYVEKIHNIVGATGTGVERNGTPNLTIAWEPGELDILPGVYACELVASSTSLDVVFHGTIQILDLIN